MEALQWHFEWTSEWTDSKRLSMNSVQNWQLCMMNQRGYLWSNNVTQPAFRLGDCVQVTSNYKFLKVVLVVFKSLTNFAGKG